MKKLKMGEFFLQVVYPRCCPVCHEVVIPAGSLICKKCLDKLKPIVEPRCMRCGKSLRNQEQEYCSDCSNYHHEFQKGMAVYPYDRVMKKSIEHYKFQGRREYGDFYAQAMAHYGGDFIRKTAPQCFIPVPMLPVRERKRGFNQSQYLAQQLGKLTGIPVDDTLLKRTGKSRNQKELTASERRRNLKNAFALCKDRVEYQRVMLIDDVYTTGSTMDVLAGLLKEAGIDQIYFLTLCQGKGL